jgi:hypothetical protein
MRLRRVEASATLRQSPTAWQSGSTGPVIPAGDIDTMANG